MPNTPSSISSGFSEQHSPNSEINAIKQFRIEELSPRECDDNNSSPNLIKFLDDNHESSLPNLDLFPELKDFTTGKLSKLVYKFEKLDFIQKFVLF